MNTQQLYRVLSSGRTCIQLLSLSEQGTHLIARKAARFLIPGDVLSLDGDLGAGKTSFTRGLASGLGCDSDITSPTFTLMIEHVTNRDNLKLYHFDAYRLSDSLSFVEAGLDEFLDKDGICVIEWGHLVDDIMPERTIRINIIRSCPEHEMERRIQVFWPKDNDIQRFDCLKEELLEDSV